MTRLTVAALGPALAVSTAARGQTVGEGGRTAAPNVDRQQLREQLKNSGNASGSTCPIRILADYGHAVAVVGEYPDRETRQARPARSGYSPTTATAWPPRARSRHAPKARGSGRGRGKSGRKPLRASVTLHVLVNGLFAAVIFTPTTARLIIEEREHVLGEVGCLERDR